MFDYTVCTGDNCSLKHNCKRYKLWTIASNNNEKYISHFIKPPIKNDNCDLIIPINLKINKSHLQE